MESASDPDAEYGDSKNVSELRDVLSTMFTQLSTFGFAESELCGCTLDVIQVALEGFSPFIALHSLIPCTHIIINLISICIYIYIFNACINSL